MKSNFSKLSVIAALLFASCNNGNISSDGETNKLTGNGIIISEMREIKPFRSISIEGIFNVTLEQGIKESVQIEGDENILPVILTVIENDTLKVKVKENASIYKLNKLDLHITLVTISNLNTIGVRSLKCLNALHLHELFMDAEGVGSIALNLEADKLTVKCNIIEPFVLSGEVKETIIDHNGLGALQAFDLKSEKLSVYMQGTATAEVFASKEIRIDAAGTGYVYYKGGATKKRINNDDNLGAVVCMDCK